MTSALGSLLERNLLEVFGQRDSARRAVVIAEIYTADCTFFESEERIVGRDALNAKIERILQDAPGFVFCAARRAQVNHKAIPWQAVGRLVRLSHGEAQAVQETGIRRHEQRRGE